MTARPRSDGTARMPAGSPMSQSWPGISVVSGDPRPLLAILDGDGFCRDLRWQDEAPCAGIGQELFYPPKGDPLDAVTAVCRDACPVRRECLTDAMGHLADYGSGRYGYWGGTSPDQRIQLGQRFDGDVTAAVDYVLGPISHEEAA